VPVFSSRGQRSGLELGLRLCNALDKYELGGRPHVMSALGQHAVSNYMVAKQCTVDSLLLRGYSGYYSLWCGRTTHVDYRDLYGSVMGSDEDYCRHVKPCHTCLLDCHCEWLVNTRRS